ncbi:hypothetical protein QE609_22325, partial [Escherichia coli]|uniref:hypothetical protein n=4 Tax=Escherichia coli TaxID=562 RepID=UPI0022E7144E
MIDIYTIWLFYPVSSTTAPDRRPCGKTLTLPENVESPVCIVFDYPHTLAQEVQCLAEVSVNAGILRRYGASAKLISGTECGYIPVPLPAASAS